VSTYLARRTRHSWYVVREEDGRILGDLVRVAPGSARVRWLLYLDATHETITLDGVVTAWDARKKVRNIVGKC